MVAGENEPQWEYDPGHEAIYQGVYRLSHVPGDDDESHDQQDHVLDGENDQDGGYEPDFHHGH